MRQHKAVAVIICTVLLGCCAAAQEQEPGNFSKVEFGGQYSVLRLPSVRSGAIGFPAFNSGIGGRAVINLSRNVAVDSEFDFFPSEGSGATNSSGGRVALGLIGVKAGHRWDRVGVFAKCRPGFQRYGRVIKGISDPDSLTFTYGRRTNLAVDFGGVFEYYPSSRYTLRLDVGDTRIRFGLGGGASQWGDNFQLSSGFTIRFGK